jgi:hypothetical protein
MCCSSARERSPHWQLADRSCPRKLMQQPGLVQGGTTEPENKWLLNRALRLDDELSTALYSQHHLIPTNTKSQTTPLKNNYNGATPDPAYIPGWRLTLDGLSIPMHQ